jgi:hypothetical protein
MPVRFNFRKEKIVTDPTFFMFKEFVDIWEWDEEDGKPKANKLFYFIFLLCDLTETNPLRDTPANKKEEEALHRVYKNRKYKFPEEEYNLLKPAIDCYIKYNEMSEERILHSFDIEAESLRDVLEDTAFETVENIKDGVTSFTSNSDIITKGLKELDSVKKLKASVIAAIRKDAMSQTVRGKQTLSPLSKGSIELPDFANLFSDNVV